MSTALITPTRRTLALADLRAEFAVRLASLYGAEVPAYNTLVEVSREVNETSSPPTVLMPSGSAASTG